ncbi:MAG: fumarate hydratase [Deltaproteobacteria bacterium]|jgi:fumarate hydratase subunit alpha|nr:fumarate hydratase [Deltaproteobacteria bacterium]
MRTVSIKDVIKAVRDVCIHANRYQPADVKKCLKEGGAKEDSPTAKEVFRQIAENIDLAESTGLPLCQDTGLAVFFVEIGQDVYVDGNLTEGINEGVRQGYGEGFLRKSACDPFTRKNTGDNTPAVIHYDIVPGDKLRIAFMAKGGGAENMSRVTMLAPAEGWEGVKKFVLTRVSEARSNPCPPILIGVGLGGTFEHSAKLAKLALMRKVDDVNSDPDLAAKEKELLALVNKLNIGPMGLGGKQTALALKIMKSPCHIASLPLAVNIQCHSSRHEEVEL